MSGQNSRRDPAKERFWRTAVRQQQVSQLKIREFCRQQGLAETAFHAWRREIQRRDRQAAQSKSLGRAARPDSRRSVRHPTFLPVALGTASLSYALEVALPSGVVLRIGRDCDGPTLRTVLGALEDGAC